MGLGLHRKGRHQPITPVAGSWAAKVNEKKIPVTGEAFLICQQIVQGEGVDRLVRDAANEAIVAYGRGTGIGIDVARVLAEYAGRRGSQDRWGQ